MTTNLYRASSEWASRPDDQRFLDIEELAAAVSQRREESWTITAAPGALRAIPVGGDDNGIMFNMPDSLTGEEHILEPTHWSFGQIASYAKAPAQYLRQLPAELAAINLQWGLENNPIRENALVLGQTNGHSAVRSVTSESYGRIWDSEVVAAVKRANESGAWKVPAASYATQNPRRATTLYASDRDVFIFLVDPDHAIEQGEDTLFRGFYAWNSEVGSATFGLTTFLYRYICDNRIIWGAENIQELKIRHTRGAPERFQREGARYLERYANASAASTVQAIKAAKEFEQPGLKGGKDGSGWESWLKDRGFTGALAKDAVRMAESEQGEARSLWDIVQGITASARGIPNSDTRVQVEAKAGKLMDIVTPKN